MFQLEVRQTEKQTDITVITKLHPTVYINSVYKIACGK